MWNGFVAMALLKQEEKKIVAVGLWQCHCQNRGENCDKLIVAMTLLKNEKNKICDKLIVAMALPKYENKIK